MVVYTAPHPPAKLVAGRLYNLSQAARPVEQQVLAITKPGEASYTRTVTVASFGLCFEGSLGQLKSIFSVEHGGREDSAEQAELGRTDVGPLSCWGR